MYCIEVQLYGLAFYSNLFIVYSFIVYICSSRQNEDKEEISQSCAIFLYYLLTKGAACGEIKKSICLLQCSSNDFVVRKNDYREKLARPFCLKNLQVSAILYRCQFLKNCRYFAICQLIGTPPLKTVIIRLYVFLAYNYCI